MKIKMVCIAVALVLVFSLVAVIVPASPISAQITWYVDDDTCPAAGSGTAGDPFCRIKSAVGNASANDIIIIAPGIYNEYDITINKSLTIQGAGSGSTIIDGQDISRVFLINNSTVDMSGMTIRNGNISANNGGGLYNDGGNVTMTNCTISGNTAAQGGGIENESGTLNMTNCTVSGNTAAQGGGIRNIGELTMTSCTVIDNTAVGGASGGGIFNVENVTMTNCTITDNYSLRDGGGIENNFGTLNMTNCTVSGNTAALGGGIRNRGNVTMTNCTVSGNTAVNGMSGGGIYNDGFIDDLTIMCTIVYGNIADSGPNIWGPYTDIGGESIIDSPDPLLGPLQDNGGSTFTHALLTGSPAIDSCVNECTVVTDQRGVSRPQLTACDVGAYEYEYQQQFTLPVGGTVEPVNKIGILAPWLGLAAFMIATIAVLFVMKSRRVA
jgi:hypothetical protein